MGSAFFWDLMQRRVVIAYQCFRLTHPSHLEGSRSVI